MLGNLLRLMGDIDGAKECHSKTLALNQDIGKQDGIGSSIFCLGHIDFELGEYQNAKEKYGQALEIYKNIGDPKSISVGIILSECGKVAVAVEDELEAQSNFHKALEIGLGVEDISFCLFVLWRLSSYLTLKHQKNNAVEILSLVTNHPQTGHTVREKAQKQLVGFKDLLPLKDFASAKGRGQERDVWETVKEMLAWLESLELKGAVEAEDR